MDYTILSQATKANCKHITKLIDRGKIEGHFKFIVMSLVRNNFNHNLGYKVNFSYIIVGVVENGY